MHFLWPSTGIHEYRSICTRCADIRGAQQTVSRPAAYVRLAARVLELADAERVGVW